MSVNPFDDDDGGFFMLVNDDQRHSLSPAFAGVPTSRRVVDGEAHPVRRNHVERDWTGLRSKGPREQLAASEFVQVTRVLFGGVA